MIDDTIKTIPYKGYTIKIRPDSDPMSPREWDNLGTMVCFHRNYSLGDEHEFKDPEELQEYFKEIKDKAVIIKLWLYDHSGITISCGESNPFSCRWDSGIVGYIFVTHEKIKENYGNISKESIKIVEDHLKHEVEAYDQFLQGNIVGYEISSPDDDDTDSCWGFYSVEEAISEAKGIIDYRINKEYPLLAVMEKGEST
jgi:hypothetical protein